MAKEIEIESNVLVHAQPWYRRFQSDADASLSSYTPAMHVRVYHTNPRVNFVAEYDAPHDFQLEQFVRNRRCLLLWPGENHWQVKSKVRGGHEVGGRMIVYIERGGELVNGKWVGGSVVEMHFGAYVKSEAEELPEPGVEKWPVPSAGEDDYGAREFMKR